ncbi:EH domain-binding protein 1-like protein 1 [Bolinopsis microptera]
MDSQNHELEQKLLKSWLHLVHERNTLVRKQDDLNSLQNEEDLEERCCVVLKEMRRYQNMRDTTKTVHDVEREEQLEEEYRDILKKRELLLRIRDDINTVSMEEEAEFRSVIEKPKLLQDQSSCKVS